MDILLEKSIKRTEATELRFTRSLLYEINWNARLIGIRGARGVGKTTLMLQYIKKNMKPDGTSLYASLDNIWWAENRLVDVADEFVKKGGCYLFLDEVHHYPTWRQEIKNIYDDHPELKIVFTGSSLLELLDARADLSRRAVMYEMQGLSYREYLNIRFDLNLEIIPLDELLKNHISFSQTVNKKIKPLQYFKDYLMNGYYPFFMEEESLYHQRIDEIINMILAIELPLQRGVDPAYVNKLKQLLQIIAASVPFMPNVSKLSERMKINRNTLIAYLHYLQEARLITQLYKHAGGISRLQKPDKIYLENSNLQFTLAGKNAKKGNIRETFFVNQVSQTHQIEYVDKGDFRINDYVTIEVGGRDKSPAQIQGIPNSYVAADDIEYGSKKKIPLWLFGFGY